MPIEKNLKKNYDLTPLTTFKIGGRAEFFVVVENKRELIQAVNWAKKRKLPMTIFSGGSNILIAKKKLPGLAIKISGQGYKINGNILSAWAGTGLSKLAKVAAVHGLSGLEWAFGIPGSLGGAVRGNAGAFGQDISGQVAEVEVYHAAGGGAVKLSNQACGFSYRHSIFKRKKNLIITNVKLKLIAAEPAEIKKIMDRNLAHRAKANPKEPSAGCIFKNLDYENLAKLNPALADKLTAEGLVRGGKIGAAYLIDQLGLKGRRAGDASISEKHANFIINGKNASAGNVLRLISLIKKKVKAKYKINLEEEIQLL